MADKADGSVVLAQLQLSFFGSVITRDRGHVVGHSHVFQILLPIEVRISIMASPVLFPPVKDFILLCETQPCLV